MAARIPVLRTPGITGFSLSRTIAQLEEIDGVDKAVLRALADHYPNIFPSVETLVVESGWCERAVRKAIGRLIRAGLIRPSGNRRGGRAKSEQYLIDTARIMELHGRQKPGTWCPLSEGNPAPESRNPACGTENPAPGAPEEISKGKGEENLPCAKPTLERDTADSCENDGGKSHTASDAISYHRMMDETIHRVWDYYITTLNKNRKLLTFTSIRKKKGLSRLDEALRKVDGRMEDAEKLLKIAVDTLAASAFHRGVNQDNKAYDTWERHLFGSQEKLEWWWEQSERAA